MRAEPAFALSRTCNLADFPAVFTVAGWQQALADRAWTEWLATTHVLTREQTVCDNLSGVPFVAPGPSALYRDPGETDARITRPVPAVFGLSVLDRVPAPLGYLTRTAALLRPQGLVVLTFAFWDAEGEDIASGHERRARIYDAHALTRLITEARKIGLQTFGGVDWRYYGHKLDDHSLASLVLTRREDRDGDAGDREQSADGGPGGPVHPPGDPLVGLSQQGSAGVGSPTSCRPPRISSS